MHAAVPVNTKDGTGFIPLGLAPGRINTLGTLGNVEPVSLGGFLTGFAGPTSAALKDLGINIPNMGVMIQALQSSSDVNVISTPHMLAADNRRPRSRSARTCRSRPATPPRPLRPASAATGTSSAAIGARSAPAALNSLNAPIQRQTVELQLKIKPQIGEGDNVKLHHRRADRGDRRQRPDPRPHHRQAHRQDRDRRQGPVAPSSSAA